MASQSVASFRFSPVPQIISHDEIRKLFFQRIHGARYLGVQRDYGVTPYGDLVLFSPRTARGTTLSIPTSVFADPEAAIALVQTRLALLGIGERL